MSGAKMSELKPCPFCGNQPEINRYKLYDYDYTIDCETKDCCSLEALFKTKKETIEAWNRRFDGAKKAIRELIDEEVDVATNLEMMLYREEHKADNKEIATLKDKLHKKDEVTTKELYAFAVRTKELREKLKEQDKEAFGLRDSVSCLKDFLLESEEENKAMQGGFVEITNRIDNRSKQDDDAFIECLFEKIKKIAERFVK